MAKVKCPSCGSQVTWNEQQKFRPFCSERCKMIDLGAWASDAYTIAGPEDKEGDPMQDESSRSH